MRNLRVYAVSRGSIQERRRRERRPGIEKNPFVGEKHAEEEEEGKDSPQQRTEGGDC